MAKRKSVVLVDIVKQRHTSHWDLDLFSPEQIDERVAQKKAEHRRYMRRQFRWIFFWLVLLCMHPTMIDWLGRLFA